MCCYPSLSYTTKSFIRISCFASDCLFCFCHSILLDHPTTLTHSLLQHKFGELRPNSALERLRLRRSHTTRQTRVTPEHLRGPVAPQTMHSDGSPKPRNSVPRNSVRAMVEDNDDDLPLVRSLLPPQSSTVTHSHQFRAANAPTCPMLKTSSSFQL